MEIDINEWSLCGDGKEGESYVKKDDTTKLLKLYHEKFNSEEAEREHELSKVVYKLGIPTPRPGEFVTVGKRKGLIFTNILNKRSFCRVISEQPERLKEMAQQFAKMSLELHKKSIQLPEGIELDDYKQCLSKQCETVKGKLSNRIMNGIQRMISNAEVPDCLNHGDLHFGNVITDGKENYYIDLGRFKLGTADYDISMLYFICNMVPPTQMKSTFHITRRQAQNFWKEFIDFYYGADAVFHLNSIRRWAIVKAELVCATLGYNPILFYLLTGNFRAIIERNNLA